MKSEFEKLLKQHRDALTDELVKLGNHRQVQLVEWDIERNETDYEFYFDGAWNAQQSKVDELKSTIEKQKKLSLKAIENAKAGSSLELQLAQKLHAESSPDSLESERAMNAQLTNENLLLESKVDELQKRVDAAQKLIDDWNFGGVHIFDLLDELEQALKGGVK